ncbi:hypothetical protein NX059_010566 [Plenodomus lindquistii]|nr:hypothetical protein NX059_010566 [Plenodomus lindquistii]
MSIPTPRPFMNTPPHLIQGYRKHIVIRRGAVILGANTPRNQYDRWDPCALTPEAAQRGMERGVFKTRKVFEEERRAEEEERMRVSHGNGEGSGIGDGTFYDWKAWEKP